MSSGMLHRVGWKTVQRILAPSTSGSDYPVYSPQISNFAYVLNVKVNMSQRNLAT